MLAALLTFAAETTKDEPNKLPFYLLGGAAAVWAVVLFAVGMRSESFPSSAAAQRGVMALSVLIVGGAMAAAVITA
jgi:hypothetical protein